MRRRGRGCLLLGSLAEKETCDATDYHEVGCFPQTKKPEQPPNKQQEKHSESSLVTSQGDYVPFHPQERICRLRRVELSLESSSSRPPTTSPQTNLLLLMLGGSRYLPLLSTW